VEFLEKHGEFSIIVDGKITVKMGMRPFCSSSEHGGQKKYSAHPTRFFPTRQRTRKI